MAVAEAVAVGVVIAAAAAADIVQLDFAILVSDSQGEGETLENKDCWEPSVVLGEKHKWPQQHYELHSVAAHYVESMPSRKEVSWIGTPSEGRLGQFLFFEFGGHTYDRYSIDSTFRVQCRWVGVKSKLGYDGMPGIRLMNLRKNYGLNYRPCRKKAIFSPSKIHHSP